MRPLVFRVVLALVPLTRGDAQHQVRGPGPTGDRQALEILLTVVERNIESAAEAMPADKYRFAPTRGEFRGVRTFGGQLKHLAATNYILAAAALDRDPPPDAGDEAGPDSVNSKAEVLAYLRGSFVSLGEALAALDDAHPRVRVSPISPLGRDTPTRGTLVVEALIHSYDHYGQMVEYLRMNGVVPPASRS
ncbi:MAG: DinB family protein [Gemmatimonadales bacterium]